MPRGQLIRKKRVALDPRYANPVVGKFVARMMERGKKSVTYTSIYGALDIIQQKVQGKEPVEVFLKALSMARNVARQEGGEPAGGGDPQGPRPEEEEPEDGGRVGLAEARRHFPGSRIEATVRS